MRDYIVSGVPLRDPAGFVYSLDYTRSELDGDVSRAITSAPDFGWHGSLPDTDNYFGSSRETLCLNIAAATKDEFNTFLRGFQGLFSRRDFQVITAPQRSALAPGSGRDGRTFDSALSSAGLLREARMRSVGSGALERISETTARIKWVLENIWGFYRSTIDYTSAAVNVNAASQVVSLSSTAGDSTAPVVVGTVRIKGPIAANGVISLRDVNSVKGISYKAQTALAATEYVIIDLQTLKATKVTTNTWDPTGGTNVATSVDLNGEGGVGFDPGAPVSGWPSSGPLAYSYTLAASGYTAGSTAVEVRLRRSFLS